MITLSPTLSALPLPFSETRYPALIAVNEGVLVDREREDVIPGPTVNEEEEDGMTSPGITTVDILVRV